jgi:hypothetical protein
LIIVLPRNSFMAISIASGVPQRIAKITAVPEKMRERETIPRISGSPATINCKASAISLNTSAKTIFLYV